MSDCVQVNLRITTNSNQGIVIALEFFFSISHRFVLFVGGRKYMGT